MKKAIFGIFICLIAIFLMSHNVGAIDLTQEVHHIRGNMIISGLCVDCSNLTQAQTPYGYIYVNNNQDLSGIVKEFRFNFPTETFTDGDYFTFDAYIFSDLNNNSLDAWVKSLRSATTGWDLINVDFSQISSGSGKLSITARIFITDTYTGFNIASSSNSWLNLYYKEYITYGVGTHWRPTQGTNYSQDLQNVVNAINSQPNYNQSLNAINDSVEDLNDSITDRNEQEDEALDNISNQTPSDISSDGETENQATTNLIGLFSSFISALSNITQAQNCNLTLNFPSYAGGSINVNVCQYKDKAGNLISVFSSLTLIVFYIPLALKLLSMIYNEIRSFTNG